MWSRGVCGEESTGTVGIVEVRNLRFWGGLLDRWCYNNIRMLTLEIVCPVKPIIIESCLV
jgi:hypothetical protein